MPHTNQEDIQKAKISNLNPDNFLDTAFSSFTEERSFHTGRGRKYWIIHSPIHHLYIRLTEEEHDNWKQLQDISAYYHDQNQEEYSAGSINPIMHNLSDFIKKSIIIKTEKSDSARNDWIARYWEITIPLPGMNRIFDILDRMLGWILRSRYFPWIFLPFCTAGLLFFLITEPLPSYPVLMGDDSQLFTVLSIYGILISAAILHVFGHALACRSFGRTIGDCGLLLYYGMPCLFIDTSDIWMADRKARIIVSLAGPAVNLWIGATAALFVWAFPESDMATLIWRVAFLSFAVTLINLCPLLEFDGYYALADLLEIPDLKKRAFLFLSSVSERSGHYGREGWFLLIYAISSAIFTLAVVLVGVYFWQEHVTALITELGKDQWEMDHLLATLAIILVFIPFLAGMIISGTYTLLVKIKGKQTTKEMVDSHVYQDPRILMPRLSK